MEKPSGLLPFAFTQSASERNVLNTDPREKHVIDENAASMYHTRGGMAQIQAALSSQSEVPRVDEKHKAATGVGRVKGPALLVKPSIKRKMGESFTEKDDVKRREPEYFAESPAHTPSFWDDQETTKLPETRGAREFWDQHSDITDPDSHETGPMPRQSGCTIPSSPPIVPQLSEYDVSAADFTIPDSPVRPITLNSERMSPVRRKWPLQQSSEPDFGIDSFNRYKTSAYTQCPSTDADMDGPVDPETMFSHARDIILQSFENVSPSISLEGMHLTDIPDEIKDLDNLVIIGASSSQVLRQLYLTNNKLKVLNPMLFKFKTLNVLSLRQNHISFIPCCIGELQNLIDLNLSINRLRFLPPQILSLSKLTTFRAGPNPFVEVPPDAVEISPNNPIYKKGLRHVSKVRRKSPLRWTPSLKALSLDVIAKYDVTYRETKSWKQAIPKLYHPIIAKAISKGKFGDKCNECSLIVVEPYALVFEWWDILQNLNVPIKRKFCSEKCVAKYETLSPASTQW